MKIIRDYDAHDPYYQGFPNAGSLHDEEETHQQNLSRLRRIAKELRMLRAMRKLAQYELKNAENEEVRKVLTRILALSKES